MSWDYLPIVTGSDVTKDIFNDIRIGINERAVLVGSSQIPTASATGDWLDAGSIFNGTDRNITTYQTRIEQLIPHFWDETNSIPFTKINLFTQQGIGNGSDWSRVPGTSYGQMQDNDDVYKEIFNEMKLALDGLTKVAISGGLGSIHSKVWGESGLNYDPDNWGSIRSQMETNYASASFSGGGLDIGVEEIWIHSLMQDAPDFSRTGSLLSAGATSFVGDTSFLFSTSGYIKFTSPAESIYYSNIDSMTSEFLGLIRGQHGTSDVTHAGGTQFKRAIFSTQIDKETRRQVFSFNTSSIGSLVINSMRLMITVDDYFSGNVSASTSIKIGASNSPLLTTLVGSFTAIADGDRTIDISSGISQVQTSGTTYLAFHMSNDLTLFYTPEADPLEVNSFADTQTFVIHGARLIIDLQFLKRS